MVRLGLIPLDERPCNEQYPRLVGKIAGACVVTPPQHMLSSKREVGDFHLLENWLASVAGELDGLIVSLETLVYGGLIPSRISNDSLDDCLRRLDVLRRVKEQYPNLAIYAFNIVMRVSNSNINEEEPLYWSEYGKKIWLYSRLQYRVEFLGMTEEKEQLDAVRAEIPDHVLNDYLTRRARNHQVNLAAVDLAADGTVDYLLFTQDDTSEFGFPNQEQHALREKISRLGLEDRALVYPGADEVGMVLVARHLNRIYNKRPRFFTRYSSVRGPLITALYEDRPLAESVKGQVFGSGGLVVDAPQDADIILMLNTPGESQGEAPLQALVRTVDTSARNLPEFVSAMGYYKDRGYIVACADVAYANGADLKLVPLLKRSIPLERLDGYAAWNTAGNTLGTVVAHATARFLARELDLGLESEAAHLEFLLLRFADDWAYQAVVRTQIGTEFLPKHGVPYFQLGDSWELVQQEAAERLTAVMNQFCSDTILGKRLPSGCTVKGVRFKNIHLPWKRMFEVGLDVEVETETND
ncbi:MAG TPA: DUF4127 family protein [Bacillota bacterium]|jgi:hypothetical protein|nr:DUF4127 family protein [Limnochordia bacterium]HPT36618.1 DUF4127 family protein [Bacillota bacterium]